MIFKGLVRVHVGPLWSDVYAPITAKTEIKNGCPVPARRWDPNAECWRVLTPALDALCDRLEAAGYSVRVIKPGMPPPPVVIPGRPRFQGAYGGGGEEAPAAGQQGLAADGPVR